MVVDQEETKVGAHVILATAEGKIIIQQRDNNPGIVNPGFIALFGGTLRSGDSVEEGLKREPKEEVNLNIEKYSVAKLNIYYKTKELDGMDYTANVFLVKGVKTNDIEVHEGLGFVCDYPENILKMYKLTRITRLAVEDYLAFVNKHINN